MEIYNEDLYLLQELLQWSQSNLQTKLFYFEISYISITGQFGNALRFRTLQYCFAKMNTLEH